MNQTCVNSHHSRQRDGCHSHWTSGAARAQRRTGREIGVSDQALLKERWRRVPGAWRKKE
jgi:hypothetical protein